MNDRILPFSAEVSGSEDGNKKEQLILVGIAGPDENETWDSLAELRELAKTAGAEAADVLVQSRARPDPATYIGSGKLEELRELLLVREADGILCDDELTPVQMRNLEKELSCKVIDRTLLILDIFAARATTSEGKLQVELAQLQHRLTMLTGRGTSLSRLGGGIGTRGPGEKKLETDRRRIRERISHLRGEMTEVRRHRNLLREGRQNKGLPTAAIVGYTNAGKSTLLNALTNSDVPAQDKLFATLDPATRLMVLPDGGEVLLTDTVGFIRKLPHHLVDAFRSTLEEARYADLILHVVDASSPQREKQMHVVYETLRDLKVENKPVITLFNKQDMVTDPDPVRDFRADHTLHISAAHGWGLSELQDLLQKLYTEKMIRIERVYSYVQGGTLQLIRRYGRILKESCEEDGIHVLALVPPEIYGRV